MGGFIGGIDCGGGGPRRRPRRNNPRTIAATPATIHQIRVLSCVDGTGGTYGGGISVGEREASGVADVVANGIGVVSTVPFSGSDCGVTFTVGVGLMVIFFLQMRGVDENTLLLSRTRHDAPSVPIVVYVCVVVIDPTPPMFCSINCVAPSPKVNSTPFTYPSVSTPVQTNVTVRGTVTPEEISVYMLAQIGGLFSLFGTGVGVGVSVGVGVGVSVGVGVGVGENANWRSSILCVITAQTKTGNRAIRSRRKNTLIK